MTILLISVLSYPSAEARLNLAQSHQGRYLIGGRAPIYTCKFVVVLAMSNLPIPVPAPSAIVNFKDEFDPAAPMKEAAMFYGLFLRGHPVESLRRDIDVPKSLLEKWLRPRRYEPNFRQTLRRVYTYRKQVLAIFDELVLNERNRARLQ